MTGYLFLDVDGVINPYQAKSLKGDWTISQIDRYDVWTSRNFGAWLTSLVDRGITIVWATTWVEDDDMRAELCQHFGISIDWPKIDRLEWLKMSDQNCGKRPGIIRFLAEHGIDPQVTPCVWVDDMLGQEDRRWSIRHGVTTLRPRPTEGIVSNGSRAVIEDALGLSESVGV
jgi:hypothetical protein